MDNVLLPLPYGPTSVCCTFQKHTAIDLPNLAKPWSVRLTPPNVVSSVKDGDNPGEGDEDRNRKKTEQQEDSTLPCDCQKPCVNERSPKEEGLRGGTPTRVLSKFGVTSWEVSVDEDRDPDGNGKEHCCPLLMLLLPEDLVKTVGAPEGPDSIACEVNVDGGADDGDEDDGVKPG